ncbi:MAG: hypothetical protein N3F03_01185 [Ignavibacteria bacterium]|nr:hypothetical protein [Ignavibacteria bacterium]
MLFISICHTCTNRYPEKISENSFLLSQERQCVVNVIPAKAGIQIAYLKWIPAYAGMTVQC